MTWRCLTAARINMYALGCCRLVNYHPFILLMSCILFTQTHSRTNNYRAIWWASILTHPFQNLRRNRVTPNGISSSVRVRKLRSMSFGRTCAVYYFLDKVHLPSPNLLRLEDLGEWTFAEEGTDELSAERNVLQHRWWMVFGEVLLGVHDCFLYWVMEREITHSASLIWGVVKKSLQVFSSSAAATLLWLQHMRYVIWGDMVAKKLWKFVSWNCVKWSEMNS